MIKAADLLNYQKNGYLIVRGVLDDMELNMIGRMEENFKALCADREKDFFVDTGYFNLEKSDLNCHKDDQNAMSRKGILRKVQDVFHVSKTFREVCSSRKVLDIVEAIIGKDIYYHSSKFMCKPALWGREKKWHQDYAYWNKMDQKQVTAWFAFDPATRENGCIKVIPGSHQKGLLPHVGEELYMELDSEMESQSAYAVMNPGDLLLFDPFTVHGSDPNHSSMPRSSGIITFQATAEKGISLEGEERYGSRSKLVA